MKKAQASKRELQAEVKRLRKQLQQNEVLMHQAAVKIEAIEAARLALQESKNAVLK